MTRIIILGIVSAIIFSCNTKQLELPKYRNFQNDWEQNKLSDEVKEIKQFKTKYKDNEFQKSIWSYGFFLLSKGILKPRKNMIVMAL